MKIDGGLRKIFRQYLPGGFWISIESGSTAQGIPDSHVLFSYNRPSWIEFKSIKGNVVPLRPHQIAWLERYWRQGGRCFIAVRKDKNLFLYRGKQARELKTEGIKKAIPLGQWHGSPAKWAWSEIEDILTS